MKTLVTFMFALTIGVNAFSQDYATMVWSTDADPEDVEIYIIDTNTSDTIYSWIGLNETPYSFYSQVISFPGGEYTFKIIDNDCDGWESSTMLSFIYENNEVAVSLTGLEFQNMGGCEAIFYRNFIDMSCDCNSCRTDLDNDGVTGVSDLLIFIASYGQTCD